MQTIELKQLTAEWIDSKAPDSSFKILKIVNCPSIDEILKVLADVDLHRKCRNFSVLVMELMDDLQLPSESRLKKFDEKFFRPRPMILQFKSMKNKNGSVFIKDFMELAFINLKEAENDGLRNLRCLKDMLEAHGKFGSDLEAWQLSENLKKSKWLDFVSRSVLLIRVINLFEGGCGRLVPWLTGNCVLDKGCLEAYLAFIDKPIGIAIAVGQAWREKNFDFLETVISKGSPFPEDFNIKEIPLELREKFEKILNQRQRLHKSIKEKNLKQISEVLKEMAKVGPLKFAYSQSNDSAFATALKHFDNDVYSLLLKENLQFCRKCEDLMWKFFKPTLNRIRRSNKRFLKPLAKVPNSHQLLSKCFLGTGHYDLELYSEKVNKILWALEAQPETAQLLRIADKHFGLKIAFDFNHRNIGLIGPVFGGLDAYGLCEDSIDFLSIAGKLKDSEIAATLAHETAHLALQYLYYNDSDPYPRKNNNKRRKELWAAINECGRPTKKKENLCIKKINSASRYFFWSIFATIHLKKELIVIVPEILGGQNSESDIREVKKKISKAV